MQTEERGSGIFVAGFVLAAITRFVRNDPVTVEQFAVDDEIPF